jgi:hypothetical protein
MNLAERLRTLGSGTTPVDKTRKRIALVVALVADGLELGFFPADSMGAASPVNDIIDGATALILLLVLGFRWRLAFALAMELVPFATLFPSWTAVVLSMPTTEAALPPQGANRP